MFQPLLTEMDRVKRDEREGGKRDLKAEGDCILEREGLYYSQYVSACPWARGARSTGEDECSG
jgi:hypothetical protein